MSKNDPILTWLESVHLSTQGLNLVAQYLSNPKVYHNFERLKKSIQKDHRILYIETFPTHLTCVTVSTDKLRGFISIIGFIKSIGKIKTHVEGISSSLGMNLNEILPTFQKKLPGFDFIHQPPVEQLFIQGTPPVPSKPSDVLLHVKPFDGKAEYQEDSEGKIDYSDLNLFQNVIENQHIGDHVDSAQGIPGKDIFGNVINTQPVDDHPIQNGNGIAYDEIKKQYFALVPGYLVYKDRKLNIEETYYIEQNVDLNVGNVNFVSDVVIHKDVLSDFSVQSGGKIDVHGTVTGATLEAEKDITLDHGVLGQNKSLIRTKGKLITKFFNEGTLEAQKDVTILTEALNSKIYSKQALHAEHAVIIGGRVVCLKEMTIGTIGSELGVKTHIFLGEDFDNLNRTEEVRANILDERETALIKLESLEKDIYLWQKVQKINPDEIQHIEQKIKNLEECRSVLSELNVLSQEYELLSTQPIDGRVPFCKVGKTIFPGTIFFCSGTIHEVKEKIKGPIIIEGLEQSKGNYKINIKRA